MNTTIETEITVGPDKVMDVRQIPCSIKHAQIIRTWMELPVSDYFILLNDHDPARIHDQISSHWPGTLKWEYLAKGPDAVRVRLTKLEALTAAPAPEAFSCDHH